MDRMGRTDQLVRYSDVRYLTFDPAEVAGCSAAPYVTDTRQSAQLHSLRASRLSPPTPPHYARACVLRWDVWMVRSSQTSTYCACAGGRGAEADLRHVSVSERPTTDIRETCTVHNKSIRRLGAPSRFLAISPKQMQISTPNFQHPLSHQFHTLCNYLKFQDMISRPQMTSE